MSTLIFVLQLKILSSILGKVQYFKLTFYKYELYQRSEKSVCKSSKRVVRAISDLLTFQNKENMLIYA